VQIAALPEHVRGFGHVRKLAAAAMQEQAAALCNASKSILPRAANSELARQE